MTELGIVTVVRLLKPKAFASIEVTELGIVIDVRLLELKAATPIEVTELGIVKLVKPESEKRELAISVIPVPSVAEVNVGLSAKAPAPIYVTVFGTVIVVKLLS